MEEKLPYRHYWFSRRAVERLVGQIRPAIAYHIRRLEEYGVITAQMRNRAACRRKEGGREVYRWIDVFNIFALRAIAHSFDTVRAASVEERCDDIIKRNNDADYSKTKTIFIDH
ncbi:hypothetical protein J6X09_00225 [Candidatus Saccharibacteria bacterium]|nr:hypothetical protein [Candidatus Saccharibacteria bacterium]